MTKKNLSPSEIKEKAESIIYFMLLVIMVTWGIMTVLSLVNFFVSFVPLFSYGLTLASIIIAILCYCLLLYIWFINLGKIANHHLIIVKKLNVPLFIIPTLLITILIITFGVMIANYAANFLPQQNTGFPYKEMLFPWVILIINLVIFIFTKNKLKELLLSLK